MPPLAIVWRDNTKVAERTQGWAQTEVAEEQIVIEFEDASAVSISLHSEEFVGVGPEAADYVDTVGRENRTWVVWREDWRDDFRRRDM